MKKSILKDQRKRQLHLDYEKTRILLKAINQNQNYPKDFRREAQLLMTDFPKRSSKAQLHHRCVLTGRGRFLVRGFNLSRFMIRKFAQEKRIPGIRKASW